MSSNEERLTIKEAATELNRSVATLRRWKSENIGPRAYSDGYRIFYLKSEVDRHLLAQTLK
ncbi:helix-turn-helix transcriptional regulator [Corynebacterium dentalis]|uniref:helix-turn-helix transcriptional regulator n=1 Tax=Corynebacterium dentalis TaxID=2014528 RepID=UPI00370DBEBF